MSKGYYVQDNSDIESTKLNAAQSLYEAQDYNGALKLYLDAVKTSYSHKLRYEIGRCYYKLNDLINAELYFQQSISLEKHKNPSYTYLGNIYYKQGNINSAIEYWTISFSHKPDDESVCLNLASAYFQRGMKFQAFLYYEKYFKYAKNKNSDEYQKIKITIDEFKNLGLVLYKKAKNTNSEKDIETAIQLLKNSVENYPCDFEANFYLSKLLMQSEQYNEAIKYLKTAFCIDKRSLDVLQMLSVAFINTNNYTGAYCCFKRMLPLLTNNSKFYFEIIKAISTLEIEHKDINIQTTALAEKYYSENNYHFALCEYENYIIAGKTVSEGLSRKMETLQNFLNPERRIIKKCFEKGSFYYTGNDFKTANKYFTKIMTLSEFGSSDYKLAKARLVNV